MQENTSGEKSSLKKWLGRLVVTATIFVCSVIGLSSFYYKTLILNPAMVWHGASMSVKALVGIITGEQNSQQIDEEFLAKLRQDVQDRKQALEQNHTKNILLEQKQLHASIAENQARAEELALNKDRLSQANQQILNSKSILNSLNQDFSSISTYQEQERAQIEQMAAITLQSEDVPTEQDAKALISKTITSSTQAPGVIPERVLENVQQTTGISPEEINELLNQ